MIQSLPAVATHDPFAGRGGALKILTLEGVAWCLEDDREKCALVAGL